MSSYKSSNYRRGGSKPVGSATEKPNANVLQLQEMFPTWSEDDLKSLLSDVHNDVELAVTRISEGYAEQWGSVTRKKDKKTTGGSNFTSENTRDTAGGRDKGEYRGGRGGRGGRGVTRGGRGGGNARGLPRGGHRETNGRHTSSSAVGQSHAAAAGQESSWPAPVADDVAVPDQAANQGETASSGWGATAQTDDWNAAKVDGTSSSDPWANGTDSTPPAWGARTSEVSKAPVNAPSAPPVKPTKTPATSKLSWAQIARAPEKQPARPAPVPPPAPATNIAQSAPGPIPDQAAETAPLSLEEEKPQMEQQGWEEPTTAEPPTWDDEPQPQPQAAIPLTADGWITTPSDAITHAEEVSEESPGPKAETQSELLPTQQVSQNVVETSPIPLAAKPATPVSYARSLNVHRNSGRFKTTDQPVVMPSSNFGSAVEKIGMQFGSVSLSGDETAEANGPESSPIKVASRVLEPSAPPASEISQTIPEAESQPIPVKSAQLEPSAQSLAAMSPPTQSSLPSSHSNILQQSVPRQALQQQQAHLPPQLHQTLQQATQQTHSSLLQSQTPSQSSISSQATSTSTSSPLTSFTQQTTPSSQPALSPYQQQSQTPSQPSSQLHATQQTQTQPQNQLQQQYSQHGFQSHTEPPSVQSTSTQSHQPHQPQPSLLQGLGGHSYMRQHEQSYFHTPTPPAGQVQETQYSSFAPIAQQVQHQSQASHLGGFSADQFGGYNDNPRAFYDSYGQQSGFGARNVGSHDDLSKITGVQQATQAAGGLPQTAQQPTQQQTSQQAQSGTQSQSHTGQPQQGYAPVPYYFNPYQAAGQFYGAPYGTGYVNQYANRYQPQQQPLFQPPNPGPASPANAKVPSGVQQQSNPYAQGLQGLYGQQQHTSSSYEDGYSHHNQLQHQHSQGVNALPSNDYNKPLYGSQGIQSFMSMGQNSTPSTNPSLGQRGASAGSPENTYKQYGGPGVGVKDATGPSGVGVQNSQTALGQGARTGLQQPQLAQGFYGANRFSSNPSAGGPPAQQTQPQQTQGYQQGSGDSSFYYQRGPSQQQQPYWQ